MTIEKFRHWAIKCLLVSAVAISTASSPAISAGTKLGVLEHLGGWPVPLITRSLDAACKAGFGMIRFEVSWSAVEKTPGVYKILENYDTIVDEARARGIEPMLVLDYGNKLYDNGGKPLSPTARAAFANYARAVAAHFKGRVTYFEIWNEWDVSTGNTKPGTASGYEALVKEVYPAIKAVAPHSIVVTGAFSPAAIGKFFHHGTGDQLQQFLAAPNMANYSDAVSFHPYVVYWPGKLHNFTTYKAQMERAVRLIRTSPGFKNKPIIVSESGWSTADASNAVTEAEQSNLLQQAIEAAKKLGISAFIIYELRDSKEGDMLDTQAHFGLLRNDWSPKPAYSMLASEAPGCLDSSSK